MKCSVIIPVGPGHEALADRAANSVDAAISRTPGPFDTIETAVLEDTNGERGRSAARNYGMQTFPADWYFLLDADDEMMPDAFSLVSIEHAATFGTIYLNGRVAKENRWPVMRDDLFRYGSRGTLSMGCFVRGDLHLAFDESLDIGEDYDFYLRLPDFVKLKVPLVNIGYDQPSAGGPRGYSRCDWHKTCDEVIGRYRRQRLH